MKLLTKEEEDAHYKAVLKGGFIGGAVGLALGFGANSLLLRRSHFYRSLTVPLRAFFISSSGTFGAIINADQYSRKFEAGRTAGDRILLDYRARQLAEEQAGQTSWERAMKMGREYRYTIVTASWAASMAGSLALVARNKYLTTAQKLVQARMYAQGLTLLILVATAGFEVADARAAKNGPKDLVHHHHHKQYDGEDLWKDMVEAEEKRQEARKAAAAERLKH
jgi:hypothetical protein